MFTLVLLKYNLNLVHSADYDVAPNCHYSNVLIQSETLPLRSRM
jgi:hypothetical protein